MSQSVASVDIAPIPVFPVRWLQGPYRGPTFDTAESYFTFGNPDTGKSNFNLACMTNFLSNGHRGIDAFGAKPAAEELIWFFSPYRDSTVMVHGDGVEVETGFAKVSASKFDLNILRDYSMVVTTRDLFESDEAHYHMLAKIFGLCQTRRGWRKASSVPANTVVVLLAREAWNIINSQIKAGMTKDAQEAQDKLQSLNKERFHTGIGLLLDTQRYMEINTGIRQLCNFRVIKGFGGQVIPDEFDYLFKPHLFMRTPWRLRNLPVDEFIMTTSSNGVCTGLVDLVPWNTHKGEYLIDELKITVHPIEKPEEPAKEEKVPPPKPEVKAAENPYRLVEQHNEIVELHNQGKNFQEIARVMSQRHPESPMSWFKARWHVLGLCACS